MDPGLNEKTASRHNSMKESKRSSFTNKDSFKNHDGKENHDSKSERDSRGSVAEQEVSPRIPRKFIANWRQACDRTKDRTKELLKRWRTLPESEIANAAAAARAQQEKDHGWSVHVWGEFLLLFLGAFANLRKASVRFVMSVLPSARNDSAPTGRIFMKFDI